MPLPTPEARVLKHTRRVTCEGFERQDGFWDIEAHLLDVKTVDMSCREKPMGIVSAGEPIHNMSIRITVDLELNILDAHACMDDTPYLGCPGIANAYQKLKGLQIAPGFTRKTRELFGGTAGCTHLLELLGPLATTAYQATHQAREARENWADGAKTLPMLNSCHTFSSQGDVVQKYWPHFYEASNEQSVLS